MYILAHSRGVNVRFIRPDPLVLLGHRNRGYHRADCGILSTIHRDDGTQKFRVKTWVKL
ncbi:MAG: hypothetical protein ACOY4Q_10160 [Bacillota bacterium]